MNCSTGRGIYLYAFTMIDSRQDYFDYFWGDSYHDRGQTIKLKSNTNTKTNKTARRQAFHKAPRYVPVTLASAAKRRRVGEEHVRV